MWTWHPVSAASKSAVFTATVSTRGRSRFRMRQRVLAPGGLHAIQPIAQELMVLGVESIGQIETCGLAHRPQQLRVIDGREEW